jgi:hypothetical protein
MNTADHYRRIRREHPTLSAGQAIGWARHELAIDRFLFDIGWEDTRDQAPFMIANLPDGQIRVFWDDEPYEWGDIEPSDFDRENLSVIGIVVTDASGEALDSCWGYGFTAGDTDREAASFALSIGALDTIAREASERAHWAARDVATV